MCVLGKRLLKDIALDQCDSSIKNGTLWRTYCNATTGDCEPYFKGKFTEHAFVVMLEFENCIRVSEHNATIVTGIKGLASGVFFDNLGHSFLEVRTISLRQTLSFISNIRLVAKFNGGLAFRSISEIPIHRIRKRST